MKKSVQCKIEETTRNKIMDWCKENGLLFTYQISKIVEEWAKKNLKEEK